MQETFSKDTDLLNSAETPFVCPHPQVLECGEEKVLALTEVERIKALAAQLVKVLRAQKNYSLPVSQLLTEYSKTFGYSLRLQDFDAPSLSTLLAKLSHVVKVRKLPHLQESVSLNPPLWLFG